MRNQLSIWICVLLLGFSACRVAKDSPDQTRGRTSQAEPEVYFPIAKDDVKISGQIQGYKAIYKTGKLTYREPATCRLIELVFPIADKGSFHIDLSLLHAVTAKVDLEGNYYSIFLEPTNEYEITTDENQRLVFKANGELNNQLKSIRSAMADRFKVENARAKTIYKELLSVTEFKKFHDDLAQAKLQILEEHCVKNGIGDKARTVIKNEIQFDPANAMANNSQFDLSSGMLQLKPNVPATVVHEIVESYPLDAADAWSTRAYVGYISNLAGILQRSGSLDDMFAFYETSGEFTSEELELIKGQYQRDTKVLKSKAYAEFNTIENMLKHDRLRARFWVATVLKEAAQLPPGIGRDMLISQSVAENFFERILVVPSASDWKRIEQLIDNRAILDHLTSLPPTDAKKKLVASVSQSKKTNVSFEEVRKRYIDAYRGKVIYIDFWSTWCSPCRAEIPDAERLQQEFAGKDVVFLNLCAQSEHEAWKSLVKQKEIGGENFLLSRSEYRRLAEHFGVKGFPTYVLIDRDGATVSKNAPRPSALQEITSALNDTLCRE